MQVTIQLNRVSVGTEISIVQDGVSDAIPAEACYLGWQESLSQLAQLVEPDIREESDSADPAPHSRSSADGGSGSPGRWLKLRSLFRSRLLR